MRPRMRRWKVEFFCMVAYAGVYLKIGKGTLLDISEQGCKVESSNGRIPPEDVLLKMRISMPAPHTPVEVDLGMVRWAKGRHFGVQFLKLQPEQEKRLRTFLNTSDCTVPA